MIEPKPKEPTGHQYDSDAEVVIGFLNADHYADGKKFSLKGKFKLNLEANHATLAGGKSFMSQAQFAQDADMTGGFDINSGAPSPGATENGWDIDEFPGLREAIELWLVILKKGGLKQGHLHFDAKTHSTANQLKDIFQSFIYGMDNMARGFLIAWSMLNDPEYQQMLKARYSSLDSGEGEKFEKGRQDFVKMRQSVYREGYPKPSTLPSSEYDTYKRILQEHVDIAVEDFEKGQGAFTRENSSEKQLKKMMKFYAGFTKGRHPKKTSASHTELRIAIAGSNVLGAELGSAVSVSQKPRSEVRLEKSKTITLE